MSDQQITGAVRQGVELLRGGVLRYSERIEVDGLFVVVRVMLADNQQPGPKYDSRTGEPLFPQTREQRHAEVRRTLNSIKRLERDRIWWRRTGRTLLGRARVLLGWGTR